MKSSRDPRIDAYIGQAAPFARPILIRIRKLVHAAGIGATEAIKWNSPFFMHGEKILCNMAAFKAHVTFGFWHRGMNDVLERDGAFADSAMGSFGRIGALADLPSDKKMIGYVRACAQLLDTGGPRRPPRQPRPEARVPADLATALRHSPKAAAAFKEFSPSHRREYIEWITEAKRPETRTKRLEETVRLVANGKSRHWKYER